MKLYFKESYCKSPCHLLKRSIFQNNIYMHISIMALITYRLCNIHVVVHLHPLHNGLFQNSTKNKHLPPKTDGELEILAREVVHGGKSGQEQGP